MCAKQKTKKLNTGLVLSVFVYAGILRQVEGATSGPGCDGGPASTQSSSSAVDLIKNANSGINHILDVSAAQQQQAVDQAGARAKVLHERERAQHEGERIKHEQEHARAQSQEQNRDSSSSRVGSNEENSDPRALEQQLEAEYQAQQNAAAQAQQYALEQTRLANEKANFAGFVTPLNAGTTSPGAFTREASHKTIEVLANELFGQVVSGETPSLKRAAHTGTITVAKEAAGNIGDDAQRAALDLMPRDHAIAIQAYRIPAAYATGTIEKVNAAYSDLFQNEVAKPLEQIRTESDVNNLDIGRSGITASGDSRRRAILNQITVQQSLIRMSEGLISENQRTLDHCTDRGGIVATSCRESIESSQESIRRCRQKINELEAQLTN